MTTMTTKTTGFKTISNTERIRNRRKVMSEMQDMINEMHATVGMELARTTAKSRHADYPQYNGYWDGFNVEFVRITRRVTTKMGVAFEKGDLAIAKRDIYSAPIVYSVRNDANTHVSDDDVEKLLW